MKENTINHEQLKIITRNLSLTAFKSLEVVSQRHTGTQRK